MTTAFHPSARDGIRLRSPQIHDAPNIHKLIEACPPLDVNSRYAYLLQAQHHAPTCVLAERHGKLCGYLSSYLRPDSSFSLFVWQVAVSEDMRGLRIAQRMLDTILQGPACSRVLRIETTVTPDNESSLTFFQRWAHEKNASFHIEELFGPEFFDQRNHQGELLLTIGLKKAMQRESDNRGAA